MNCLGTVLRSARADKGWTQARLAEAISRSKTWVVDVERGRVVPQDSALLRLMARELEIDEVALIRAAVADRLDAESYGEWFDSAVSLLSEGMLTERTRHTVTAVKPRSNKEIQDHAEDTCRRIFASLASAGRPIPVVVALGNLNALVRCVESESPVEFKYAVISARSEEEGSTSWVGEQVEVAIREDVFNRASHGDGRSRFTVAHEIAHALLHARELRGTEGVLFRDSSCTAGLRTREVESVPAYSNPEHQANVWASSFLMPFAGVKAFLRQCAEAGVDATIGSIAKNFQVSYAAAQVRMEQLLPRLTMPEVPMGV